MTLIADSVTTSAVLSTGAAGFVLSLSLIAAIGAQHLFVLRQGAAAPVRRAVCSVLRHCRRDVGCAGSVRDGRVGGGKPLFARPSAWRVLDLVTGITMLALSAGLMLTLPGSA